MRGFQPPPGRAVATHEAPRAHRAGSGTAQRLSDPQARNPPVQNIPAKSPTRSRALRRRTTHQVHLQRLHLTSQEIFSPNPAQLERASRHDRARLAKELASQGVTTSLEQLQSPLSRVELLSRAVGRQRDDPTSRVSPTADAEARTCHCVQGESCSTTAVLCSLSLHMHTGRFITVCRVRAVARSSLLFVPLCARTHACRHVQVAAGVCVCVCVCVRAHINCCIAGRFRICAKRKAP